MQHYWLWLGKYIYSDLLIITTIYYYYWFRQFVAVCVAMSFSLKVWDVTLVGFVQIKAAWSVPIKNWSANQFLSTLFQCVTTGLKVSINCSFIFVYLNLNSRYLFQSIGNLSESTCHVCEEDCGNNEENNLSDFRCCWCQWTVHEKCQANLSDLCNLGVYRNFIIPPNCIKLKTRGRLRSQCLVSSIREPQWGNSWKPLIVIGKYTAVVMFYARK